MTEAGRIWVHEHDAGIIVALLVAFYLHALWMHFGRDALAARRFRSRTRWLPRSEDDR